MLLRRKLLSSTVGKDKYKVILKSAKIAKQIDRVYNDISTPVTLAQITQTHFHMLYISHSLIIPFLITHTVSSTYDSFSFVKDVSEGAYNVVNNLRSIDTNNVLGNMIKIFRLIMFIHRVNDHMHIIPQDFSDIETSFYLDYLTFAISHVISRYKD